MEERYSKFDATLAIARPTVNMDAAERFNKRWRCDGEFGSANPPQEEAIFRVGIVQRRFEALR